MQGILTLTSFAQDDGVTVGLRVIILKLNVQFTSLTVIQRNKNSPKYQGAVFATWNPPQQRSNNPYTSFRAQSRNPAKRKKNYNKCGFA